MTYLVYFDSNVIIDICEGRLDSLRSYVLESARTGEVGFPFTAAQISEITEYPLTGRCRKRLEFVGKMSNNLYFVHSVHDYGFRTRSPYNVWETINEALPEFDEKIVLSELVPFEQIKGARKELGLDPKELNNLSGHRAVEVIDKALSDLVHESPSGPRSIKELLEYTKLINRQAFAKQWDAMDTSEAHMTIESDLQAIFSLLETFGYWPDTEKVYRKGSRFPDSQHVFNSAHCHCLVTRDKGMKNRAEAVFSILGIGINVFNTEQYISELGLS
jgi:hypothetical protein